MAKLFVCNFPWATTNEELAEHFSDAGFEAVSAQIIEDAATKRSKGFGFVQLKDESQNDEAIEQLHDQDFNGRALVVKHANPDSHPQPRADRASHASR